MYSIRMGEIQEYNDLVEKWNKRYGHICEGATISEENIQDNIVGRIETTFLSDNTTERKKLKHTVTVIGDFSNISPNNEHYEDDKLTRGELAYLVVQSGQKVLDKY